MFSLTKHYYDGIDNDGNAIIVYDAVLCLFGLPIPYSAVLLRHADGTIFERSALRRLSRQDNDITQEKFSLRGRWQTSQSASPPIRLFKNIDWHCHTPQTAFHAQVGDVALQGLGYAETLKMTLAPWHLPMRELYWGRFLSSEHHLVWIEWRGDHPLQVLLYNGKAQADFYLHGNGLATLDWQLTFTHPAILRDAPLINLTKRHHLLRALLPRRFLQSQECKWLSPATLQHDGGEAHGWALYERVLWS